MSLETIKVLKGNTVKPSAAVHTFSCFLPIFTKHIIPLHKTFKISQGGGSHLILATRIFVVRVSGSGYPFLDSETGWPSSRFHHMVVMNGVVLPSCQLIEGSYILSLETLKSPSQHSVCPSSFRKCGEAML